MLPRGLLDASLRLSEVDPILPRGLLAGLSCCGRLFLGLRLKEISEAMLPRGLLLTPSGTRLPRGLLLTSGTRLPLGVRFGSGHMLPLGLRFGSGQMLLLRELREGLISGKRLVLEVREFGLVSVMRLLRALRLQSPGTRLFLGLLLKSSGFREDLDRVNCTESGLVLPLA